MGYYETFTRVDNRVCHRCGARAGFCDHIERQDAEVQLSRHPNNTISAPDGEPLDCDGVVYAPRAIPHRKMIFAEMKRASEEKQRAEEIERFNKYWAEYDPEADGEKRWSFERILINRACGLMGVEPYRIRDRVRSDKRLLASRSLIAKLLREKDPKVYSFPRLKRLFGRSDHTTITYSVRQFPAYCKRFPDMFGIYKELGGLDDAA